RGVRLVDDRRPAGLRVDLQPDGDAACGRFLRRPHRPGHDRSRAHGGETESDADASLHLEASRVRRACRSLVAGGRPGEWVGSASWLVPHAIVADPRTVGGKMSIPFERRLFVKKTTKST